MINSDTMRPPNGPCDLKLLETVFLMLFSFPQNHCAWSSSSLSLQLYLRTWQKSDRKVLSVEPSQLKGCLLPQGQEIQQFWYKYKHAATDVPGPGNYKPQNDLSREGKYVLSRNKSAGKRAIMDGRRQSFIDLTKKSQFTPGPGSYRTPSDFGHYDNKRERQTRLSKSQMLAKSDKMTSAGKVGFSWGLWYF